MKTLSVMQDTVGNQEFTVLVVDDDESTRRLYTTILGRAGFKVIEAPDGANALTVLGEGPVSLVLLDSRMPGMSGIDVLSVIRAERRTRTLPVILVTGETEPADRVGGLDAGADDYLTKPVDVKELVARVRAQLRGQSAWTEVVDGLQRRASAVDALSHLELGGRIDEAAQRICRVITSLEGLSGAAIIALTSPQFAVPLAAEGPLDISLNRGSALDETVARALWRRATDGPWLETVDSANAATLDVAANATAYSPLRVGDRLRGLLVVTSSTAVLESDDRTLSAAIDFGIVSSALLGPLLESDADVERTRATIRGCITDRRYVPNYQPIVELATGTVVGFEALTRWDDGTRPDLRFAEAHNVGLGIDLEFATASTSIDIARQLDDTMWLSVNASAKFVLDDRIKTVLAKANRPIVLEVTEHERVDDYGALREVIEELGSVVRVAVDDAGAGYASLHHVLQLDPAFVKLDISWIRDLELDPARRALVAGLQRFAQETGCDLIAEGIETEPTRQALLDLGVRFGQGYLLGRPAPLAV